MTATEDETATVPARRRLEPGTVALAAIVAAGVAARVAWSIYAARPAAGFHDPAFYRLLADQLASGNGYHYPDGSPTAYFPVGYPLALAAAYLVTPASWESGVVAAANVLWQAIAIVVVHAIVRRLLPDRLWPALVAAGLTAAWPNLVLHAPVALSESLFIVLVLGAVLAAVGVDVDVDTDEARPPWRRLALVGVLLGLATLVRPVSLPVVAAIPAGWLLTRVPWRRAVAHGGIVAGAFVLTLVPWLARNLVVMDALVLSTNVGDNLCMSRSVGASGGFEYPNLRCTSGPFDDLARPEYETERDAHGRREALEFVRDHPGEELRLVVRRARITFRSDDDALAAAESYGDGVFLPDRLRDGLRRVSNTWYAVLAPLGAAGLCVLATRRRPAGVTVVAVAAALAVAPLLSFGDVRFKMPVLPFLAIGAAVVLDAVDRARVRRGSVRGRRKETAPPVAATSSGPPDPAR